ncbi:MAG TPA: hypothetical protein P5081_21910 [Phycisphaerae bacterium]|nr:hypothetical protein [Phycisphaerae bacterium]HRW55537.1 hypothetical protein [Phycisphaerae bacterium]
MELLAQAADFGTYTNWMPPNLSVHGERIDTLIDILHYFMAVLFVGWGIFFAYCLVRFRAGAAGQAQYHPVSGKVSKYAEVGVAIFEAVLLLGFSIPVWGEYKNNPPAADERIEVRAIGEQFQWNFHYPGPDGVFGRTNAEFIDNVGNTVGLDPNDPAGKDDIQTIGELHLPVGKPIYIRITSKDVIHSFAIPTMRVKQDAIPGMEVPVWFTIKEGATTKNLLKSKSMNEDFDTAKVTWYRLRHHVASKDYTGKAGQVVLAAGDGLGLSRDAGEKKLRELRDNGVTTINMHPANPLEVICAQLCGNSHFKMKAQLFTYDDAGYEAWKKSTVPEVIEDF